MGVYLIGVHLMGGYLMDAHLTGRTPHWACTSLGVYLIECTPHRCAPYGPEPH
jgi:hypothetical protein